MSWDWIAKAEELKESGTGFAIATITKLIGSAPREISAKMIVEDGDGNPIHGTIGGGALERQVIDDAIKLFNSGESKSFTYKIDESVGQRCGGTVEVMIEVVARSSELYIFGAGHVGQALCRVLQGTPFRIHLIDERDEWVNSQKIPSLVKRHHMMWDSFLDGFKFSKDKSFVVIMTYDHRHDMDILQAVIKKDLRYVGVIGSKNKWARFQKDLLESGLNKEQIAAIHCPIGLPIGGKSPSEVAISVAAELIKTYNNKTESL